MATEEEKYLKDMEDAGVEIPDLEKKVETPEEKTEDEKKVDTDADKKAGEKTEGEDDDDKSEAKPDKKRSIYDDLKENKREKKEAVTRAETAERERDELRQKIAEIEGADTQKEKDEALDEFEEFAKKIGGDPAAIREMRDLFLKGIKPDESTQKDLLEFKEWKKEHQKEIDDANFEREFTSSEDALKELFPNAKDSEMKEIKTEMKKLAHSKDWNDKPLDYIAFKNKTTLGALISPRKKGLETRETKEDLTVETEFDPSPDFAKMSPAQREAWEKQYKDYSKSPEGLTEGARGKKSIT